MKTSTASRVNGAQDKGKRKKILLFQNKGQALIEFALTLSIFLLILAGMIDFGRMIYTKHTLDKVTREAARAGAVETDPEEAVKTAEGVAKNIMGQFKIGEGTRIQADVVKIEGADAISVSATQRYLSLFSSAKGGWIPPVNLTSTATMRKEG